MKKHNRSMKFSPHPEGYDGLPFVSLIRYATKMDCHGVPLEWSTAPCVVHNVKTYSVDYINLDGGLRHYSHEQHLAFLDVIGQWWASDREMPVGFWLAINEIPFRMSTAKGKRKVQSKVVLLEIIGPAPSYNFDVKSIKRRTMRFL